MSWMQEQMVTVQNCFFLFHKPLAADEKKSSNPLPIYSVIVHFFNFFDSSISTKNWSPPLHYIVVVVAVLLLLKR